MTMPINVSSKAYEAAIYEDWEEFKKCYTKESYFALRFPLTVFKDKPIHLAVFSKGKQPLEYLLDVVREVDNTLPMEMVALKNKQGNTPLHVAASVGNYEAAKLLVEIKRDLLEMVNNDGETAMFKAAANGRTRVMKFLASQSGQMTPDKKLAKIHRQRSTNERKPEASILHAAIQGEHFGTALALLELDITLAEDHDECGMSSLQHVANMPLVFRSGYKMGFWKSFLYFCLPVFDDPSDDDFEIIDEKEDVETQEQTQDLERDVSVGDNLKNDDDHRRVSKRTSLLNYLFREQPILGNVWKQKRQHKFAFKLAKLLIERDNSWEQNLAFEASLFSRGNGEGGGDNQGKPEEKQEQPHVQEQQETPLLTATRSGIIEIVNEILRVYPHAVEHCSSKGQNILHISILHRRKKIFDKVKRMTLPMARLVNQIDEDGKTLLHCVADMTYYSEGPRPGPAYQLQHELYWFKRVDKIAPAQFYNRRGKDNLTAQQLFRQNHEKQLKAAQEWIKETAQSCSTVAVLVSTVVFAAAYTVPGGSNARGLPNFLDSPLFLFFTIMDVVSLTESLTAVVMFLSILSSPSELEDFYESLPGKLKFGFTMLFLSVTTTMLAFTATILLVIRLEPRQWTSTLVYTAAFIPVGILALTQFPLYVAFMDTMKKIFKTITKIIPLNRFRRQLIRVKEGRCPLKFN